MFGIKSLIHFSHSFQNNHHPITITIKCLHLTTTTIATTTTATTTTTRMVVHTTIMLCRYRLTSLLLLCLLVQVKLPTIGKNCGHHHQDRITAANLRQAVSQPGFLHAASSSRSSRANDGSNSSRPVVCTSSHICHGPIAPLLSVDKMKRRNTTGPWSNCGVKADPKEVADFRSALKAGGFPPLIPGHFLKDAQDCKNNAGLSSYA